MAYKRTEQKESGKTKESPNFTAFASKSHLYFKASFKNYPNQPPDFILNPNQFYFSF